MKPDFSTLHKPDILTLQRQRLQICCIAGKVKVGCAKQWSKSDISGEVQYETKPDHVGSFRRDFLLRFQHGFGTSRNAFVLREGYNHLAWDDH
jgi:hypothetical protein